MVERLAVRDLKGRASRGEAERSQTKGVSSACEKSQDEKASKFRETPLRYGNKRKGNPEPSPQWEGAETRHSLPKTERSEVLSRAKRRIGRSVKVKV